MKSDRRASVVAWWAGRRDINGRADWHRTVNYGRGLIDDRRGLLNDRLLHHDGLGVNDGSLRRLGDDLLGHDRRGLLIDDGGWLINHGGRIGVNGRRIVNRDGRIINRDRGFINRDRLGLECSCDEQARSHTCHNFTSGGPFAITGFEARSGSSDHSQCCDCH